MTGEPDRMARAGNYVLGLMNADDRERAERDLEIDPAFRDAVVSIAARMRIIDLGPTPKADNADQWKQLARRIAEMPHMRSVETPPAPPLSGRSSAPSLVEAARRRLHAAPSWRTAAFAACVIAAFAAGYLAGLSRP
jgi:anti-sigma-K factor RskA